MMTTMRHPLEAIPAGKRLRVFAPLFALTLLVMVVLNVVGNPQPTEAAPFGIVSFELAGSAPQARAIINSWNEAARLHAAFGLGLDYVFMLAYSATIGLACLWAARVFQTHRWPGGLLGNLLAWGQWLAAGLDAIENIALLILLFGTVAEPWPQVSFWCAAVKFALISAGLVYAAIGGLAQIVSGLVPTRAPVK